MKVIVREMRYKTIEVPDDSKSSYLENMIDNKELLFDDRNSCYEVLLPNSSEWKELF